MVSKKRRDLYGRILFILPIIIIISVVSYAYIEETAPGTLKVIAYGQDKYVSSGNGPQINATFYVAIGTHNETFNTPASLSVTQGSYTVVFAQKQWYTPPRNETLIVSAGTTVYSAGVYSVIPRPISYSGTSFNVTSVSALHGITPVIWMNPTSSSVILYIDPVGRIDLVAGGNYTHVFSDPGTYVFGNLSGSINGTVSVV